MTMDLVTRDDLGWPSQAEMGLTPRNTNLGMIAHYDGSNPGSGTLLAQWAAHGHAACVAYWKRTRNAHINGNGWTDIGYAYFVCPDRKVFEGRGYGYQQAAELPTPGKLQDGNIRYISVTFGLSKGEHPTDGQLAAWWDLREWLLNVKGIKAPVFGHRDFTSTDCPGATIYELVQNGTLSSVTPGTPEGDLVAELPTLKSGDRSFDVLTVRALVFERYLSSRWDADSTTLYAWMRNQSFTNGTLDPADDLRTDVTNYQRWAFPDEPSEWDGVVGPKTWRKLLRLA